MTENSEPGGMQGASGNTMPVLSPEPIHVKDRPFFEALWTWFSSSRNWRFTQDWRFHLPVTGTTYVIPRDFVFDGASVPRRLRAYLSPTGLLLVPGILHDYGYRYDHIWVVDGNDNAVKAHEGAGRAHWDQLFYQTGNYVNGLFIINWLSTVALVLFGWLAWCSNRRKSFPKLVPENSVTGEESDHVPPPQPAPPPQGWDIAITHLSVLMLLTALGLELALDVGWLAVLFLLPLALTLTRTAMHAPEHRGRYLGYNLTQTAAFFLLTLAVSGGIAGIPAHLTLPGLMPGLKALFSTPGVIPGLVIGILFIVGVERPFHARRREFYGWLLIALPLFYWAFAALAGDWQGLGLEVGVGLVFIVLGVTGMRMHYPMSMAVLSAGFLLHGVYDLGHAALVASQGVPIFWPAFCAAVDLLIGAFLLTFVLTCQRRRQDMDHSAPSQ